MADIILLAKIRSIFSAAANRVNLVSGEDLEVSLGKISKWLSDLKTVAFTGSYNDLTNKPTIPTVNNGTLTIQQNGTTKATFTANQSDNSTAILTDTTYSAGDTMTLDNTTFDIGKRWTAVSKGQTWSRLFYSGRKYVSTGSCGILTLGATRPYVVYNASFLVIASASTDINQSVKIIQMSGARYSSVRVRAVTDKAANYYFEIYDTEHSIAVGTEQTWNCRYIPLLESNLTPYTSFTDGTTIPTNWVAVNDFTTSIGSNAVAIKNITRSGNTFTATRQDGSTFTFDQNAALATNATVTLNGATTGTSNFSNDVATIDTKRKSCCVGNASSSFSATPYYKVASVKGSLEANKNYRLVLYVQQSYGSNGAVFGILDIDIRTNADSSVGSIDAKWLISASGINPEDFIVVHDKTAGGIDIYCKSYGKWQLYRFVVLSESNEAGEADDSNVWTLYNDTTGIAELPTGDNIVIVYSSLADVNIDIASDTVTSMTGYAKASTANAITTTDTLNQAIVKLEKGLDGAAPLTSSSTIDFVGEGISLSRVPRTTKVFEIRTYTTRNEFYFRSPTTGASSRIWFNVQPEAPYIDIQWKPSQSPKLRSVILSGLNDTFFASFSKEDSFVSNNDFIFKYNYDSVGDFIGKTNNGAALSGSTLDLWYETIRFNGKVMDMFAHSGQSHNCIWRGKYLGDTFTAAQKAAIADGSFDDLFVGDYWLINNIHWRIAHINYYLNTGDTATTAPHLVIVPDESLASSYMNATNITTGAYVGSYMYTTALLQDGTEASDSVFGKIKAAFGEENILSIRQIFSNAVDSNGNVSGWAWYSTRCFLMNQAMVYGQKAWANGNNDGFNVGIDKTQLALFAHNPTSINTKETYWLRDVRDSTSFALVYRYGYNLVVDASYVLGVRPVFLLKGA